MATIKSIEEKAKAYDEAIERAKHSDGIYPSAKELKEYIFPELRESEDEEMKREIIEFLKSRAGFKQEWIDWLNKQSEKKESYIDMSLVDAVRFCVADNLAHKSTDDNGNTIGFGVYIDDTTAQKLTNELSDIFQKPIEWSEDDKTRLDEIVTHLKGMVSVSDIDFLKSLKDKVLPQPKQEWCEDTQQWIDTIIKDYEEWYEADIDHRATIQAKINTLKSLRPQSNWKPSDEQIKAVRLARSFVTDDFSDNPTLSEILIELEEQLKKLREE